MGTIRYEKMTVTLPIGKNDVFFSAHVEELNGYGYICGIVNQTRR